MWYQLTVEGCPNEDAEAVSNQLEESGALSITLTDKNDNPILEPELGTTPLWPEVVIQALYARAADAKRAEEDLHTLISGLHCSQSVLADKDWERVWMDDFKPQRFGKRLWICPTWSTPPVPSDVQVFLDPGLAFGTGHHPTTALCLSWLDEALLLNKSLIDYGCGSGILALAALKLGALSVFAVDRDKQALEACKNNARANKISQALTIGFPESLEAPVDIIVANILLGPLQSLRARFHHLLKPKGELVVSGLLREQTSQLIETYAPVFTVKEQRFLEDWALLVFAKG